MAAIIVAAGAIQPATVSKKGLRHQRGSKVERDTSLLVPSEDRIYQFSHILPPRHFAGSAALLQFLHNAP
jgi:hypothetical protein